MRHTYRRDQRKILVTGIAVTILCLTLKIIGVRSYTDDSLRLKEFGVVKKIAETEALSAMAAEETFLSASEMFSEYALPVSGTVTSGFGYRNDPFGSEEAQMHSGIDIAAQTGTEIYAFCSGTVTACKYSEIGGNYIQILHDNGFYSYYGHLSELLVSEGETVSTGQLIALSGQTGKVTGPHLHFQLTYNGRAVDPTVFIVPEKE